MLKQSTSQANCGLLKNAGTALGATLNNYWLMDLNSWHFFQAIVP